MPEPAFTLPGIRVHLRLESAFTMPRNTHMKGKSAISIARNFLGRKRNFTGESFWARGYFVSTVGLDEEVVREYIRHQEKEGQRLEQLNLVWSAKKAQ